MTRAGCLLAPLALLAAAPAMAQDVGRDEDIVPTRSPRPVMLPRLADIQAAFDVLDKCRGRTELPCLPPERTYRIHTASCMRIAERTVRAVACRIDMTMIDTRPRRHATRLRDHCARFKFGADGWSIFNDWDRPCEMPSVLTTDPEARPSRAQMQEALLSNYQCDPGDDGMVDCFVQPDRSWITASRCTAIAPSEEGWPRIACRITGRVRFSNRITHGFSNLCIRFQRYTQFGESPAVWGTDYVPATVPCEVP